MRILLLNYEYPPLGGGAGNATYYIAREYAKRDDVIVDIVTSSHENITSVESLFDGKVRIYRVPVGEKGNSLHVQSRYNLIAYTVRAFFCALKLTGKKKYNCIHAFFGIPCGFQAMLLKLARGVPYIVSLRGSDVPGYSEKFPIIYAFVRPLIRLIWKNADAVISNSAQLKVLAHETAPEQKISVIPNGIDTREFRPRVNVAVHDPLRVIFVARLTPRKGVGYFLKAVCNISKTRGIHATIVGDGEMMKDMESFVTREGLGNVVTFLGAVKHEKLADIYREADIFVFPSVNEGMSNSLLEALASGLPVVVTDVGGTSELVSEGVNGFIVPIRDDGAIMAALLKFIDNPTMFPSMSQKSREVAERMSWENVASKYCDVYLQIAQGTTKADAGPKDAEVEPNGPEHAEGNQTDNK